MRLVKTSSSFFLNRSMITNKRKKDFDNGKKWAWVCHNDFVPILIWFRTCDNARNKKWKQTACKCNDTANRRICLLKPLNQINLSVTEKTYAKSAACKSKWLLQCITSFYREKLSGQLHYCQLKSFVLTSFRSFGHNTGILPTEKNLSKKNLQKDKIEFFML